METQKSLKEIQENMGQQIEANKEEMQKSLKERQEKSSSSSSRKATTSGTKVAGSWQALRLLPLTITRQMGCKQRGSYSAFHHTEASSELCLPPVSYKRLSSILALGHQRDLTA